MSVAVYEDSLRGGPPVVVRYADGRSVPLNLARWQGLARGADDGMLRRVRGAALDIGCGPGRLVAALAARGIFALGIDIAPEAVGLTRRAGGRALQMSVFGDLPHVGRWTTAVLADGNIGIGGDPVRLLRRTAQVLAPGGRILVELERPGVGLRQERVRLEDEAGRLGSWFAWAHVGMDALPAVAAQAGLAIVEQWSAPDPPVDDSARWFAALARA